MPEDSNRPERFFTGQVTGSPHDTVFLQFEPSHRQLHRCVLSYIAYSASNGFVIRFWSRQALLLIPGSRITDYSHAYREFGPWFTGTFFMLSPPDLDL